MKNGLVAMLALVLAGCGSKTEEGAAQRAAAASAKVAVSDEVAAVLVAGPAVAKVRSVIESLPVVGRSFKVKVVVASATPVPQLLVKVEGADMTVEPSTVMLVLGEPAGGGSEISNSHTFSVTAAQEGLTELAVRLTTTPEAPESVYMIPVLVSKPGPA